MMALLTRDLKLSLRAPSPTVITLAPTVVLDPTAVILDPTAVILDPTAVTLDPSVILGLDPRIHAPNRRRPRPNPSRQRGLTS